jgi:hypothetical protein
MKTRTARTVPLHEHLIEQGFMSFVKEMGKARCSTPLPLSGPLAKQSLSRALLSAQGRD